MSDPEPKIPQELTKEVFALAARLYSQANQEYSLLELEQAGLEAQIPPEFVQQAVRELRASKIRSQKRQLRIKVVSLGLGIAFCLWSVATYNTLNDADQKVDAAWAQVENQLQRRSDLIPKLIALAQTYAQDDSNLIEQLTNSKQSYLQANTQVQKIAANAQSDRAIAQFQEYIAKQEPLHLAQATTNLEYELTGTENRISVERMRYNQAVQAYNHQVKSFPTFLLAPVFGFHARPFFPA